jgi:bleomycin hydrolase
MELRSQDDKEKSSWYEFTIVKENPATSVKNQYRTSTCWSFSSLSFIESELLRMGKGEYDLSDMFVVRKTYADKAVKYVRFQGEFNFGPGGAFHDVFYVIKNYGIVPEEIYDGKKIGEDNHMHGELDAVTKAYMDAVLENENGKLSPVWLEGFNGILDAYLGESPENFTYNGKEYTPVSFAQELGINPDDYIEIGSYTHHPFYEKFIIEIPDNWMLDQLYNVPLDDMMAIIDNSINSGYTVAWGSDVSEKGFSWKNGIAIVPDENLTDLSGTEKEKWEKLTEKEKKAALYSFESYVKEKDITQELRQEEFDNYLSTDDHGMLITGIATDQNGNRYYKIKNSWGTADHIYEGYFFASEAFVKLKTIDIMVHKNAVPKGIRNKLGY